MQHKISEKLEREIWWVLQRIAAESYLTLGPLRILEKIPFEISPTEKDHAPSYSLQLKILGKLHEWEAIHLRDEIPPYKKLDIRVRLPGEVPSPIEEPETYLILKLREPTFEEIYTKYENLFSKKQPTSIPSTSKAQKKVLGVLEGLYEQWDLAPKKPHSAAMGHVTYLTPRGEVTVSSRVWGSWQNEDHIDFMELTNILKQLQEAGLIDNFKFIPEYM